MGGGLQVEQCAPTGRSGNEPRLQEGEGGWLSGRSGAREGCYGVLHALLRMGDVEWEAEEGYVVGEAVLQFLPEVLRAQMNQRHGLASLAAGVNWRGCFRVK